MLNQLAALLSLQLVLASGRAVTAHDAVRGQSTRTSISHYNINYLPRQAALLSTSSISSAPNPALGATTSMAVPGSVSQTGSVAVIVNTAAITPPTYPTIIHFTALPPSTSKPPSIPSKYHKRVKLNIHMPAILLRPYVLAPISAVLGLIQGISFAWCCIGRRRCTRTRDNRRARSLSLEPGPPYSSTPMEDDEDTQFFSRSLVALNPHDASPSKYSVHGSKYMSSQGSLWLEREISRRSQQPGNNCAADIGGTIEKAFLWPVDHSQNLTVEEDDPFLVPPSRSTTIRTAATTTMSFQSAEENPVPYDMLRHKSIRRGILERLKFDTFNQKPRSVSSLDPGHSRKVGSEKGMTSNTPSRISSIARIGSQSTHYSRRRDVRHGRSDSDLRVDDVKRPEKTYSPASTPRKERSLVRGDGDKDETEWVAGTGFRLVQEDPDHLLTPSRNSVPGRRGQKEAEVDGAVREDRGQGSTFTAPRDSRSPFAIRESVSGSLVGMDSRSRLAEVDKYTPLPVRKTPTKKTDGSSRTPSRRSSNSRSRRNSRSSTPKILSSCPLQVMSPPLESQLPFCSPFMPPSVTLVPHKGKSRALDPIPSTISTEKANKVHSPTPLPLPFASSLETSPFCNLLGKDPAIFHDVYATSPCEADSENTMSPSPRNMALQHNRGTPAARQSARHDALTKVDQIMLKGWNERDLKGAGGTASPTMFGAMPGGEFQDDIQQKGRK